MIMELSLELKKKCAFFWLRGIKNARIDKCCAKCFIGDKFNDVYEQTRFKSDTVIKLNIEPNNEVKAYYLCGLSNGFKYDENTHIVFVPCDGQSVVVENDRIKLKITNAREVHFQNYKPNPEGDFTEEQRHCRNWIFANYLLDGMPL